MRKYSVRSDMEGLTGVVAWEEVVPGTARYELARGWLHGELDALGKGLISGGADYVEIYDEHYYGLNVDAAHLPAGSAVIRGKPPYTAEWAGGLDATCSGLILQGYHAMAGCEGGVLPHTYEPDIQAIYINDMLVGEIGVEAAIAGDAGVPLVMLIGDAHGAQEAVRLIPGVETVVVKTGRSFHCGCCRAWADVREEILVKAEQVAKNPPKVAPFRFEGPVTLRVSLREGAYRSRFEADFPQLCPRAGEVVLPGLSVSAAWADYWRAKDRTLAQLKPA